MRAALFDVDGTLVDTNYIHAVCWGEALRQHGHVVPMSRVHHAIGMASGELLAHLLGAAHDESDDDQIDAAHGTLYRQYWGRLTTLPGAPELLRAFAARGARIVLASSASAEELAMLREVIGADDVIHAATSSSDAPAGKPAPDIVRAALAAAGVDASDAVLVGDSVWDAHAATRAGVEFVGLTCGGTDAALLRAAGAADTWVDPAHLATHLEDRSPTWPR
jgi:HAD superfamily hydrolase (TIGR01509 family)